MAPAPKNIGESHGRMCQQRMQLNETDATITNMPAKVTLKNKSFGAILNHAAARFVLAKKT
jgi:hypothetical protein